MKINTILLLIAWTATCTAQRVKRQGGFFDLTQQWRCMTPRGKPGVCINIKKCGSLVELLVTQWHNQEVVNYLRESVCSFEGTEPVVCCSKIEGGLFEQNSGTTKQPPDLRPRPLSSTTESALSEDVISNRILPRFGGCGISTHQNLRIVGGVNASLGDWPWVAALGYQSTKTPGKIVYLCGGSIITNYHILTAAHCVYNRRNLYLVRVGDLNLSDDTDGAAPADILIVEKIIHKGYNPTSFVNDIAILRLARPIQYTKFIQPICLPLSEALRSNDFLGSKPFVAGWGTVSFNGPSSNIMQFIQLPVVREAECQRAFSTFKTAVIDQRVICAGFLRGGKDACKGDSGGPLMSNEFINGQATYIQIGVVSYGYKCAEPGFPGVYTRITEFLDWIAENVK